MRKRIYGVAQTTSREEMLEAVQADALQMTCERNRIMYTVKYMRVYLEVKTMRQ